MKPNAGTSATTRRRSATANGKARPKSATRAPKKRGRKPKNPRALSPQKRTAKQSAVVRTALAQAKQKGKTKAKATAKAKAKSTVKNEAESKTKSEKDEPEELLLRMPHPKKRDAFISQAGYRQHIQNNLVRVENDMDATEAVVKSEEEIMDETRRLRAERDELLTMEARRFIWKTNIEPALESLRRDMATLDAQQQQQQQQEDSSSAQENATPSEAGAESEEEEVDELPEEEIKARFAAFARKGFAVDLELDVFQATWKSWFESKIVAIKDLSTNKMVERIPEDAKPSDEFRLHIHFFGWAIKYRVWLKVRRGDLEPEAMRAQTQFAPPATKTSGAKFGSRRRAMIKERREEKLRAMAERRALDEEEEENQASESGSDDDDDDDDSRDASSRGTGLAGYRPRRGGRRIGQALDLTNIVSRPRRRRQAAEVGAIAVVSRASVPAPLVCVCGEKHYNRDLDSTEKLHTCQLGCGRAFHAPCYKEIYGESLGAASARGSLECYMCRTCRHECYACNIKGDDDDDEEEEDDDDDVEKMEAAEKEAGEGGAVADARTEGSEVLVSSSSSLSSSSGVMLLPGPGERAASPDQGDSTDETPVKCSMAGCSHFYHPSCVWQAGARCRVIGPDGKPYPANEDGRNLAGDSLPNGMICPQHCCRGCFDRNPETDAAFKRPRDLVACITCDNSYHERCLPHGGLQNELGLVCNKCAREYDAPLSATSDTVFLTQKSARRSGATKFDPCRHLQSIYKNTDMSNPLTARMRLPELQDWHNEIAEKAGGGRGKGGPAKRARADEKKRAKKEAAAKEKPKGKARMPKYNPIKHNLYVAPCRPITNTELLESTCKCKDVCEENCDNHMLRIECVREGDRGSKNIPVNCKARACNNQHFQLGQNKKVRPIETPGRGWGLQLQELAHEGDFIVEYVGEVLAATEARKRMEAAMAKNEPHVFQLDLGNEQIIDARKKGNLARFVNHSCDPNCALQKWNVRGVTRVGIIAKRRIEPGEELSFDYSFEQSSDLHFHCLCGAANCRGTLTAVSSKSSQAKMELERVCQDINRLKNLRADLRGGLLPQRQLRVLVKQAQADWQELREKQAAHERRVSLRVKRALPPSRVMQDVTRITTQQTDYCEGQAQAPPMAPIFLQRNVWTGADMQRRAKLVRLKRKRMRLQTKQEQDQQLQQK